MFGCMRSRGFSLIELVIVVVILGVVAAIAVPRLSRGAESAGTNAYAKSMNELAKAIEKHHAEGGTFPGQQPGKKMPAEIADQFHGDRGNNFSTLGGGSWQYTVNPDGSVVLCAKFSKPPTVSRMQEADAFLDDGNLATGSFTKKSAVHYELLIR